MSLGSFALCWAAFTAAALALYAPALSGPFFSDDFQYIVNDPYIQTLGWREIAALFDPQGEPSVLTWNYAPVHLLLHMLQWQAFGAEPLGYRVTNVVLHAGVSALLGVLFERWGIPRRQALALAVLFLVHPANVESVAWIFQVKTILALGLPVAALLAFRSRPLLALALFVLGMLSKVTAVFALPVAALWLWTQGSASRRDWLAWAAWLAVALIVLAVEFPHFQNAQEGGAPRYDGLGVHARSIVAIAGRYLAMAAAGHGLAVFHETPPASSPLDPWWLFGLLALAAFGARSLVALRRRSVEAAYWAWAAASFAPICQIFPFLYPMGDHYLYPILPGLLGAGRFVGADLVASLRARGLPLPSARSLRLALLAAGTAVALLFGARAFERATLWRADLPLVRDSADRYPEGRAGVYLRARRAAARGDYEAAARDLERLAALGFDGFAGLYQDPTWAPMARRPDFEAALAKLAENWLRRSAQRPLLLQSDLRARGLAHLVRGDLPAAIREYEIALERGGPLDELLREELRVLRERAAAAN